MRLFIAIELPKTMKKELSAALRELKARSSGGRFVPEENMHITLHFIGESNDLVGAVKAMKEACCGIRPFELHPEKYGFFEKGDKGRKTSFISVGGKLEELSVLREMLESALSDNGFSRDYHRFIPHITLGRNVEHDELVSMELGELSFKTGMTVSSITLFESRREGRKMVYNPLHREKF